MAIKHKIDRQLHKFGGSSLADSSCYQRVVSIIAEYSQVDDLIVVSASGTTTNQLIQWCKLSQKQDPAARQVAQDIQRHQMRLINELFPFKQAKLMLEQLASDLARLTTLLTSTISDAEYAEVVGHGEIWSARIMTEVLNQQSMPAVLIDARAFLCAERAAQPQVDEKASAPLLKAVLQQHPQKYRVITGFICRNKAGETVLLGRNGSDYSATQIGVLAKVARVTIWSDVLGVYSADPRQIQDACLLPLLRLDEASELARLSAPLLHTRTLQPIAQSNTDLELKCSYQPAQGSTRIERILASRVGAKIVTSHDEICLIELYCAEQHSFTDIQHEVKQILQRAQLTPLACGIHTDRRLLQLCYTAEVVNSAFMILQDAGIPARLQLREGFAMVALVGAGICHNALHSHRFYQQLSDQPVEFFWQSPEGISLVAILRIGPTIHLVQGLHQSLFRAEKQIGIVLLGKGSVGARWLELFAKEQKKLSARSGRECILAGVVDHQLAMMDYQGLDASWVLAFFTAEAVIYKETELWNWMWKHPYDAMVVIDVTGNSQMTDSYLTFARLGFHVISANKHPGSASSEVYRQIRDAFAKTGRHWLYNATVGAGLPINYVVRDLRESGDTILSISGIFSGTFSWLLLHYDGQQPFTELVKQAWQQGLTEPDPREDLSGKDVMRKLVILVREAGYPIEPTQVRVESLVLSRASDGSIEDFLAQADLLNQQMQRRLAAAQQSGLVLRYVARFDAKGNARVGIEALKPDHPLAMLNPGDNIFALESRWYRDTPLIITGPGSGRDVAAGAIQSDLNRLASLL